MEGIILSTPASAAPRHGLRAYAAGTGVSGMLVAAAVVAFVSLAAFVAFSGGLPFLGSGSDTQHVVLRAANPAARAAANAGAPATVAVAATSAGAIPAGAPGAGTAASTGTSTSDPTQPASPADPGGLAPTTGGDGTNPSTPTSSQPGVVGGTVSNVDNTTSSLGVNTDLSGTTQSVTAPVDNSTRNVLNGVGGALGNPQLGNNTSDAVNGLTGGLLGGG